MKYATFALDRRSRSRAMATVLAVGMIAVVAIALTSIVLLARTEFQLAHRSAADVQIRQLLIAGERIASDRLAHASADSDLTTEPPLIIELPTSLRTDDSRLTISIAKSNADQVEATVVASAQGLGRSQTLTYGKAGSKWMLRNAELSRLERAITGPAGHANATSDQSGK